MIQIKGTKIDNLECYTLTVRNKQFLFFNKPNLQNLKHFALTKTYTKNGQQQIQQQHNNHMDLESPQPKECSKLQKNQQLNFGKLKVHLNLNYLKQAFTGLKKFQDKKTLNLMVAHYQQFIVLPYIIRLLKDKHQIKIFSTHIMNEMGRIYIKSVYNKISQFDLLNTQPTNLSYQDESNLQDEFYINFGVQIKTWSKLFSRQQMESSLKVIIKMNYGQIYEADGVNIRPFSSGHSLGSAFWTFQNVLTKQNIVFIKEISSQKWRSFSHNHLLSSQKQSQKFRQKAIKDVDLVILANNSLIDSGSPDSNILKLMKNIEGNLQKNINTEIVLQDQLLFLDIVEYISFQMKDKFKSLFIQNRQFNQIVSYANSYVQFLSSQYKQKIYRDPPQYPFQTYLMLRHKGALSSGSFFQISDRQKIPLKQLLRRSTPYIHFKSDFSAYLEGYNNDDAIWYKQNDYLSAQDLNSLFKSLNPKRIISFTNIYPHIQGEWVDKTGILEYSKHYSINSQPNHYYISKNISSNIINKYEVVEGYLMAYPVNRQFLRLSSTWQQQLQKHLKQSYRPVQSINQKGLKTASTQIWVENYQIFIKGSLIKQIQLILQIISTITRTLRLK